MDLIADRPLLPPPPPRPPSLFPTITRNTRGRGPNTIFTRMKQTRGICSQRRQDSDAQASTISSEILGAKMNCSDGGGHRQTAYDKHTYERTNAADTANCQQVCETVQWSIANESQFNNVQSQHARRLARRRGNLTQRRSTTRHQQQHASVYHYRLIDNKRSAKKKTEFCNLRSGGFSARHNTIHVLRCRPNECPLRCVGRAEGIPSLMTSRMGFPHELMTSESSWAWL